MTDARLRSHERRAAQSGDTESHARLIAERLRAGALSPLRVEAAAYCGSEAARMVLGQPPAEPVEPIPDVRYHPKAAVRAWWVQETEKRARSFSDWLSGLSRYGQEAQVAAALGAARAVARRRADEGATLGGNYTLRLCVAVLDAAEKWLAAPCVETRAAWWSAFNRTVDVWGRPDWLPGPFVVGAPGPLRECVEDCARAIGEPSARSAASEGVIRWALGDA